MWEKILISDRKNKKRKPRTDLIIRKDTSHPAQNLKRKRRKKKGPKRFVLFSHCLHQQNYRIQRYGSLESHEKSWERGFSAQQTGFFRLFLSAAASLFPRQSCLFARILTGTSLYSQGNVYTIFLSFQLHVIFWKNFYHVIAIIRTRFRNFWSAVYVFHERGRAQQWAVGKYTRKEAE